MDYKDWEMGREVVPFTIGPLTVAPVWNEDHADIRIDPSVVFGNGFHPSTRLCLETLVNYSSDLESGFSGLDLGCGTGLLSIGAALLGASSFVAIDNNSLACEVTRQNTVYNNVQKTIEVRQLDLRNGLPDTEVDIVLANLHHSLLIDLFE
jgi:ribosomal protein L11 methyltransferase